MSALPSSSSRSAPPPLVRAETVTRPDHVVVLLHGEVDLAAAGVLALAPAGRSVTLRGASRQVELLLDAVSRADLLDALTDDAAHRS